MPTPFMYYGPINVVVLDEGMYIIHIWIHNVFGYTIMKFPLQTDSTTLTNVYFSILIENIIRIIEET